MRTWGASGIGRMLAASVRRVAGAATLKITAPDPNLAGSTCAAWAARLLQDATSGHVIVPFWSAHQVTIALLASERFGFRSVLEQFEIIADDSCGGEIMTHLGERLGLRMRRIHVRGNPRRLEDLATWLRTPRAFFMAVDGGTEYRTVPTGIVRLAARLGSILWPIAISARPSLRIPGLVAEFPIGRPTVALAIGMPLQIPRAAPVAAVAEQLRTSLNDASGAAASLLTPRTDVTALGSSGARRAG